MQVRDIDVWKKVSFSWRIVLIQGTVVLLHSFFFIRISKIYWGSIFLNFHRFEAQIFLIFLFFHQFQAHDILIFSPIPGSNFLIFPQFQAQMTKSTVLFFTALSKLQLIRKFSLVLASQDKFPPREMLLFRFCVHHCGTKNKTTTISKKLKVPSRKTEPRQYS